MLFSHPLAPLMLSLAALVAAGAPFDCSFNASYPRQYIAYKTASSSLVIDGRLDDAAWLEVPFTERFVDISTATPPRLATHAKVRWDDTFLYIGALLEEPQAFANITSTCHCISPADQVVFHDNDFEIFVDAAGTTHFYKEAEFNALNASWDLQLNRPYDDGGGENSSRVYGPAGWDYDPPIGGPATLHSAAFVQGAVNDPALGSSFWSIEVALPLAKLASNTPAPLPVAAGDFWRINFSRVEWAVRAVEGRYWKEPSCQSCPVPGAPNEGAWGLARCWRTTHSAPCSPLTPRSLGTRARPRPTRTTTRPPPQTTGCGRRRAPLPCTCPKSGACFSLQRGQ
jgi:hypothetical protein